MSAEQSASPPYQPDGGESPADVGQNPSPGTEGNITGSEAAIIAASFAPEQLLGAIAVAPTETSGTRLTDDEPARRPSDRRSGAERVGRSYKRTIARKIARAGLALSLLTGGATIADIADTPVAAHAYTLEGYQQDSGYVSWLNGDPFCNSSGICDTTLDQDDFVTYNCTSYVAYRLNEAGLTSFNDTYGLTTAQKNAGDRWGDAGNWIATAALAQANGYDVSSGSTPEPGAVAVWDDSSAPPEGHVAYVDSVTDGVANLSEYNAAYPYDPPTYNYNPPGFDTSTSADNPQPGTAPTEYLYIGEDAPTSYPDEIAYVDTSGDVDLKSGAVSDPFTEIWNSSDSPAAASVELSPTRIAILTTTGDLYVNELPITHTWQEESTGVSTAPDNYQITDDNVSVLLDGGVYVKEGSGYSGLSNDWEGAPTPAVTSAVSFEESQNDNLAAQLTNGDDYVAWGGYGSSWTLVAGSSDPYAIGNNDIAAIIGGDLDIMEGAPVDNYWQSPAALTGAESVELSAGGNIGAVDSSGNFDVAWGGYGSSWIAPEASDFVQAEVSDDQVGAIFGTDLDIKQGTASGSWKQVADNAVEFAIS